MIATRSIAVRRHRRAVRAHGITEALRAAHARIVELEADVSGQVSAFERFGDTIAELGPKMLDRFFGPQEPKAAT